MSDQRDAVTTRSTLIVLRTVTAVLAVCALLTGLVMSSSEASKTLLGVGLVLGAVAVVLAAATGAFRRLGLGSAIVLAASVLLVGLVLIDLTNG
jgi:hypothetical protein